MDSFVVFYLGFLAVSYIIIPCLSIYFLGNLYNGCFNLPWVIGFLIPLSYWIVYFIIIPSLYPNDRYRFGSDFLWLPGYNNSPSPIGTINLCVHFTLIVYALILKFLGKCK